MCDSPIKNVLNLFILQTAKTGLDYDNIHFKSRATELPSKEAKFPAEVVAQSITANQQNLKMRDLLP